MRSRSIMNVATALAAALALAGPASAATAPDADKDLATWSAIPQWVAPFPVANDDQSFQLAPNTTRTYTTQIPEIQPGSWHVLAPCWGFDIVGPGVDVAAGGVNPYGYLGTLDEQGRREAPTAQQAPDGTWFLPDADAETITPWMLKDGELCRKIGWSFYVSDPARAGGAFAAAARKARRTHRNVRVRPRKPTGRNARRANAAANAGVTVELAGLHLLHDHAVELVVRVTTGDLAGPTTLFTHARVLLQHQG